MAATMRGRLRRGAKGNGGTTQYVYQTAGSRAYSARRAYKISPFCRIEDVALSCIFAPS
jgi:hypothetical protein